MKMHIMMVLLLATGAMAGSPDDRLGLHANEGAWRFYRCSDMAAGLPRVLLIGDSIVNGYRGDVQKALHGNANVDVWLTPMHLNSHGLLEDMKTVLAQGPYNVIHFNIGLHGWPPGRIPEGDYEPLLRTYVAGLRRGAPDAKLIWCSTTQISVQGEATQLDPEHNPTIVSRNAVAARVMEDCQIEINDLYVLMSGHLAMGRGDKFHWNQPGSALQAEQVVKTILGALDRPAEPNRETNHPESALP